MSTIASLPQPGSPREIVAAEIRALLGRYGRTQTDLATRLGMSQSQLSKRLRGAIPFDTDELVKVADYFGVTVGSLFGEATQNAPRPDGPGGVSVERAWRDSNSQPSDPKVLPLRAVA